MLNECGRFIVANFSNGVFIHLHVSIVRPYEDERAANPFRFPVGVIVVQTKGELTSERHAPALVDVAPSPVDDTTDWPLRGTDWRLRREARRLPTTNRKIIEEILIK